MSKSAQVVDLTGRLPTQDEIRNAADAAQALAAAGASDGRLELTGPDGQPITLAASLGAFLIDVLSDIASGKMVTVVQTDALLTTQQAADMLNVSRPFLSGLLKGGQIDHIRIGTHRRVKLQDLLDYRERREQQQLDGLKEIARLGQEFDEE